MTDAELAPTRVDHIALRLLAAYVVLAIGFAAGEFIVKADSSGASCPIVDSCYCNFVLPDLGS
jgi:hypothetical protein